MSPKRIHIRRGISVFGKMVLDETGNSLAHTYSSFKIANKEPHKYREKEIDREMEYARTKWVRKVQ